jgi:DNA-binding transcriptional ArsR family regulator
VEKGGMVSRSEAEAVIFRSKPVLFLIDMSLPVDRFGWIEWGVAALEFRDCLWACGWWGGRGVQVSGVLRLTELEALGEAAECLRTLAHPHRLRMVQMLLQGQYTVGDLALACDIPSAMASEHLRLMQRCGFLGSSKDGRKVYYRVVEQHLQSIMSCIESRFGVSEV